MSKKAAVTEADMRRAFSAATRSGLTVHECIMTADNVRLVFSKVDEQQLVKQDVLDTRVPEEWD